jgi:hypothetical protein
VHFNSEVKRVWVISAAQSAAEITQKSSPKLKYAPFRYQVDKIRQQGYKQGTGAISGINLVVGFGLSNLNPKNCCSCQDNPLKADIRRDCLPVSQVYLVYQP